jgi:hypothetical protein
VTETKKYTSGLAKVLPFDIGVNKQLLTAVAVLKNHRSHIYLQKILFCYRVCTDHSIPSAGPRSDNSFDREKLNIHSSFPSSNVLVRNPAGEPARSLYLTNDIVKKIIDNNEYTHIRLVTSGTKMFGRQEGKGPDISFRVLGEGLNVLLPFIPPEFILTGNIATLAILMKGYYPLLSSFPEEFRSAVEAKRETISARALLRLIWFISFWESCCSVFSWKS